MFLSLQLIRANESNDGCLERRISGDVLLFIDNL